MHVAPLFSAPLIAPGKIGLLFRCRYRLARQHQPERIRANMNPPHSLGMSRAQAANVPNIKPRGPSVDDAGLALDLAARGEGVALARSLLARSDIDAGLLVPLFDLAIRDRFAYWLVVRPGIERRSDVSAFTEWIRRECIDSVGPPVFNKVAHARSNASKRKRKVRASAQDRRAPNRDYPRRNAER